MPVSVPRQNACNVLFSAAAKAGGERNSRDPVSNVPRSDWTEVTHVASSREGDDFSCRALVTHHDFESVRRLKSWAVLVPELSSLYQVDGRAGLYQRRHPYLHHRIADLFAKLNFQSHSYYRYLCSAVLLTFDRAYQANQEASFLPTRCSRQSTKHSMRRWTIWTPSCLHDTRRAARSRAASGRFWPN